MPTGYTLESGKREISITTRCPICLEPFFFKTNLEMRDNLYLDNWELACNNHQEGWIIKLKHLEMDSVYLYRFSWPYNTIPGRGDSTIYVMRKQIAEFVANNMVG